MPSSTHQAKRPYAGTHSQHHQSSITSYFSAPSASTSTSSTSTSTTYSPSPSLRTSSPSSPFPALPPSIQSSLLNVGMRVRKSVPEGYKTGSYSSFALFSDQAAASSAAAPPAAAQQQQRRRMKQNRAYAAGAAARELAPFCGIMKVGGLAQQVSRREDVDEDVCLDDDYDDEYDDQVPGEEDFPVLSSQGSTLSNFSTATRRHKRRASDDDNDDDDDEVLSWADAEVSPKSRHPHPGQLWGGSAVAVANRTLAVPRRRAKVVGGEQENAGMMMMCVAGGDFEDAGFLDYGALGEVDMGGL